MAMASTDKEEQLTLKFEEWLDETLRLKSPDQASEISMFTSYISSSMADEDVSNEEKRETIRPFIQELNQNNVFNEDQILEEIITSWEKLKLETSSESYVSPVVKNDEPNATDTILNMISKHKAQVVTTRRSQPDAAQSEEGAATAARDYRPVYDESSEEDEATTSKKDNDLFANTNAQEAQTREKKIREQLSETHKNQKDQAKKALADQKLKEEERKKKAQQKAAKVERKR